MTNTNPVMMTMDVDEIARLVWMEAEPITPLLPVEPVPLPDLAGMPVCMLKEKTRHLRINRSRRGKTMANIASGKGKGNFPLFKQRQEAENALLKHYQDELDRRRAARRSTPEKKRLYHQTYNRAYYLANRRV
jgi:hypothetical protein